MACASAAFDRREEANFGVGANILQEEILKDRPIDCDRHAFAEDPL